MLIKRPLPIIPLKEMENGWVLGVPCKTIVDCPGFELCKTSGLGVDGFEGIGVLRVGVDCTEDAEFVFWDGWELGEEFSVVEVRHSVMREGWRLDYGGLSDEVDDGVG